MYLFRIRAYLAFAKTDKPNGDDFTRYKDHMLDKKLSRSTINSTTSAIRRYHDMIGVPIQVKYLKPADTIPYYFSETDISNIFSAINNIKHYAMLATMFYQCLRASELCALNDSDLDFEAATMRIRDGKMGKSAIIPLKDEVSTILRDYLAIRPAIVINGEIPLFVTDYYRRWTRYTLHKMFINYKRKSGICKVGGLHVFGRHSPASIMIKNGIDIMTLKELMRHSDIETTVRYLHISDETKRHKHNEYLVL